LRQAYDYWQDQPGSCLSDAPTPPPSRRKAAGRQGASREKSPAPPKRTQELVSTGRSARVLRDRLGPGAQKSAQGPRRLTFLESSLRVLPTRSQRCGGDRLGASKRWPNGPPAGAAVPPAGRCRSRRLSNEGGLRTDTDCSGRGFGGMLAHRVAIQAPQPRLHTGTKEARGQPSADWACAQSADFETRSGEPDQDASAAGRSTQERSVTHQLPGRRRLRRNDPQTLHRQAGEGKQADNSRLRLNRLTGSRFELLACCFLPLLDLGAAAPDPTLTPTNRYPRNSH